MKIIDMHTHILPEEVCHNPAKYAQKDDYYGFLTTPSPANHTEQRYATYQEAVRQMDEDGVDMLAIQGWGFMSLEMCRLQNDYSLKATADFPERIVAFCIANPHDKEDSLKEVRRCLDSGMVGIGEMNPFGQRFNLDDVYFLKMCDMCIEADALVNLHVSEPVGHNYFGKADTPLCDFIELIRIKPKLKLILSHYGGGIPFFEMMPDIRELLKNVYYDTAGSPLICSPDAYPTTMDIAGSHKLLFGTDYPLLLYPKQETTPNFKSMICEVEENVTDKTALEAFLGQNALSLLEGNLRKRGLETCL